MKSKFEPDVDSVTRLPAAARLIDPEAYDASEQRFAASVDEKPAPPRFIVDGPQESSTARRVRDGSSQADGAGNDHGSERDKLPAVPSAAESSGSVGQIGLQAVEPDASLGPDFLEAPDSGSWRHEVADRVNNYRARRRPRVPRYPSLQLKFDPPESSWTEPAATSQRTTPPAPSRLAVAMQEALPPRQQESAHQRTEEVERLNGADAGARILEFPRSAPPPVFDELAEPVMHRPRILEVPDLLLPPPALGGILMEPVEEPEKERRPGFELPLQAAAMAMRLLAGAIDTLLAVTAFAVFAYVFFKITSIVPPLQQVGGISVSLIALFWIAYQYLLLVYTGTTPGLKLAHLQLSRFDGTPVPRTTRRWRVLASILSGFSLGLGYAWCFLDEDRLCWHDRITRTYMAPQGPKVENAASA